MLRELNQVMDYIETHLTDDLSLARIAEYAGVSDYHFRKIFYYLSGMSLHEYIKHRKLSEASKDLWDGEKVTDVAFKYGYQSVDGFSRAFKKWAGCLPSDVMRTGLQKTFPKLSFVITVTGGMSMEFRIETKPAFNFVGVSKRVPMQFEGVNEEIVQLALSITDEQKKKCMPCKTSHHTKSSMFLMMLMQIFKRRGYLTHLIGVLTTEITLAIYWMSCGRS